MYITVFGASGKVGRLVIKQALAEGHTIAAFVHKNNPFQPQEGLRIERGDISDAAAVARALEGSDAVISTLGSWHTNSKNILATGMANIIPVMEQRGVGRIVTLTGAGALWSGDHPSAFDRAVHRLLGLGARAILEDGEAHIRALEASGLVWTCVRSPIMTPGNQDHYELRSKLTSPLATIPRQAVVTCLLDQIANTDFLKQAPVIYR